MATYEITIPGRGTFEIESPTELSDAQAYQAAMAQSQQEMKESVKGVSGGITRGLRDPIDAMAQTLPRILSYATSLGGNVENEVSKFFADQAAQVDALNLAVEQKYQEQRKKEGREGVDFQRITGNIVNPANLAVALRAPSAVAQAANVASRLPYMATVGQKAVQAAMTPTGQAVIGGATAGMLEPVFEAETKDFGTEKAKQAGFGAVTGGIAQKAISGVGRVLSPQTSPEVRALAEQGVELTPGQIFGGGVKRLEEGLKSIPVAGDVVAGAERRSIESFNRATVNEALKPIGAKVPKNLVGRELIQYADDAIGKSYNKYLTKIDLNADNELLTDLANITTKAFQELPQQRADQLNTIIGNTILDRMKGQIKGTAWKSIDSDLGRLASNYLNSQSGDERLLGSAIKETQLSVRNLLERANPKYSAEIAKTNRAFADFLRVQKAASSIGAQEGVFSPAQLLSATRALDESLRKGKFAKGQARLQGVAESAKSVMGANLPDSGTAYRGLTGAGVLGGAYLEPTTLLAPLAASALYSKPGQDLARLLIMQRPELLRQAGAGISRTSPIVSNILTPGLLGEK
jgi:hypothetical protein